MTSGEQTAHAAAAVDNSATPGTASDQDRRKGDCEAMAEAVLEEAIPVEVTDRLSAAGCLATCAGAGPRGARAERNWRTRAKKDAPILAELVDAATLPRVVNRRDKVARVLVEILDDAKFVGFEPKAVAATDDRPRLRVRALRGGKLVA